MPFLSYTQKNVIWQQISEAAARVQISLGLWLAAPHHRHAQAGAAGDTTAEAASWGEQRPTDQEERSRGQRDLPPTTESVATAWNAILSMCALCVWRAIPRWSTSSHSMTHRKDSEPAISQQQRWEKPFLSSSPPFNHKTHLIAFFLGGYQSVASKLPAWETKLRAKVQG